MASIFLNRRLSSLTNLTYRLKLTRGGSLFSSSTNNTTNNNINTNTTTNNNITTNYIHKQTISSSSSINDISNYNKQQLWSESNWSQFGKQFSSINDFPLPGQIGLIKTELEVKQTKLNQDPITPSETDIDNRYDLFYKPLPADKQINTIMQAVGQQKQLENEVNEKELAINRNSLELKAYKCPKSLLLDFQNCFPTKTDEIATVITVSLKADNDMSMYNSEVEDEREVLMKKFIDIAQNVCVKLKNEGYWVDFIDPCSGRPTFGPYTPATFYETDERYRQFGFEIVDYGCCKVISHHKWGTKSYVGSILTSARHDSQLIQDLIKDF